MSKDAKGSLDNKARLQEAISASFEKFLAPSATIERNVRLKPIIPGLSGYREVDVLITNKISYRTIRVMVEVQKRSRKVGLNDFNAWLKKQEELGIQFLICVSEAGFTKSVIERAEQCGDSVTLISLEEIKDQNSKDDTGSRTVRATVVEGVVLLGLSVTLSGGYQALLDITGRGLNEYSSVTGGDIFSPNDKVFYEQGQNLTSEEFVKEVLQQIPTDYLMESIETAFSPRRIVYQVDCLSAYTLRYTARNSAKYPVRAVEIRYRLGTSETDVEVAEIGYKKVTLNDQQYIERCLKIISKSDGEFGALIFNSDDLQYSRIFSTTFLGKKFGWLSDTIVPPRGTYDFCDDNRRLEVSLFRS